MLGRVDNNGYALLGISLKPNTQSNATHLDAWIDTGFSGENVLPQTVVDHLGLPQSNTVKAELGDGSSVLLYTYTCFIEWFNQEKQVEVNSNDGQYPLLGVGLLLRHKLTIDYPSKILTVE